MNDYRQQIIEGGIACLKMAGIKGVVTFQSMMSTHDEANLFSQYLLRCLVGFPRLGEKWREARQLLDELEAKWNRRN